MKPLGLFLSLVALTSLACNALVTAPTLDPSFQQTQVALEVAATLTALSPTTTPATSLPTNTPAGEPPTAAPATETSLPSTPRPVPTAFTPTSESYPNAVYALASEQTFGDYTVRYWQNGANDAFGFEGIVSIAASGESPTQIENVMQSTPFDPLSGTDINGDGFPEIIVNSYTGGAHCCSSVFVATMSGSAVVPILQTIPSNCGGRFIDLNSDGIQEFDTCDDSFAYAYCSYAASPIVRVIYQFDPANGYQPASPKFTSLYAETIAQDTQRAEQAQPGEYGENDNTNKCSVLPIVLDYLYSGQTDKAWSELSRLYTFPDVAQFRSEIENTVFNSPRYAVP